MFKGCSPSMVFQKVLSSFSLLTISDGFIGFQAFVVLDYGFFLLHFMKSFYCGGETLGPQEEQSDKHLTDSFHFAMEEN